MGKLKDKGTQFYVGTVSLSPPVMVLPCISGIDGLAGARQNIDVTCFDSDEGENEAGRAQPGQVQISAIYDTNDQTFPELEALFDSGETAGFYIGGSDGTDPPTLDSTGLIEPPTTRSGIDFRGYVADLAWQIQQNNVWRYTITIQRTGKRRTTRKQ
jgi:hypothetical protein